MCLENAKYQGITDKDIIVYKHIIITDNPEKRFTSSYKLAPIVFNKVLKSNIKFYDNWREVEEGLHSFVEQDDAEFNAENYRETLVECVIPKGSKLYVGDFEENDSYASDKLIYKRIIANYDGNNYEDEDWYKEVAEVE